MRTKWNLSDTERYIVFDKLGKRIMCRNEEDIRKYVGKLKEEMPIYLWRAIDKYLGEDLK